jgi:hypothetical protein
LNFYKDSVNKIGDAMKGNQKNVQGWAEVVKTANFQASSLGGYASSISVALGNALLPTVQSIGKWAASVITYFQSHPLVSKIASDATIGLFVSAVVFKLGKGMKTVFDTVKSIITGVGKTITGAGGGLSASEDIILLRMIATNTAIIAGEDGLSPTTIAKKLLPTAAAGLGVAAEATGAIAFLPEIAGAVVAAGITYGIYKMITGPHSGPLTQANAGMSLSGGRGASLGYKPNGTRSNVTFNLTPR